MKEGVAPHHQNDSDEEIESETSSISDSDTETFNSLEDSDVDVARSRRQRSTTDETSADVLELEQKDINRFFSPATIATMSNGFNLGLNSQALVSLFKLIKLLLDPIRRLDFRKKQFRDFVPWKERSELHLPKQDSKLFLRAKADKFLDLWNAYQAAVTNRIDNENVLFAFEEMLAELMDCFDHPKEIAGFDPFEAFASFVEAGALLRCSQAIKSASRLTLGLTPKDFTSNHRRRVGAELVGRLLELHLFRRDTIDRILTRWSDGKFRNHSTCNTCGIDPWEIFLLSIPLSLKMHGTRYIDRESASDSSSDMSVDDEEDLHRSGTNGSNSDSDTESKAESDPDQCTPFQGYEHPTDHRSDYNFVRNYGPNAYVLKMVSMEVIGLGVMPQNRQKVCARCGYRYDGKTPAKTSMLWTDLKHAVQVARQQIQDVPEEIDLTGLTD